jgi:Zn-dependent protease with chaperone function
MVQGTYFDGQRASAHQVSVTIDAARVIVSAPGVHRDEPLAAVSISERIGQTPRFVRFGDGGACEITDIVGLESMLGAAGLGEDRLSRWERSRGLVAVLAALLLVGGVAMYRVVLPRLAMVAADRVPLAGLETLTSQTLSVLDSTVFEPSALPTDHQNALARQFARLDLPAPADLPMDLVFRSSPALGANALALPSGTIVVTDELVKLAVNDLEVMAVLAHEAGHVQARHGMRNVIQSSVMSILVTWYVGDVSGLAAAAPTALLEAKYSRDLEEEADLFAARTLMMNGMSVGFLIDILQRLEHSHQNNGASGFATATAYLSSHPTTPDRLSLLRQFMD